MAPQRRPKRKFEGERMEEMLRHFRIENMGFDEEVVKTVAKQILKAYDVGEGTDGGWCFIAQDNYKLLIEQILEYQEKNQPEGYFDGNEDDFFEDEPPNDEHALAVSGEPSALTEMIATQEKDDFFEDEPPNDEHALAVSGEPSALTMIATQEKNPEDAEGGSFTGENHLLTSENAQENEAKSSSPVALNCSPYVCINKEDEEDDPDEINKLHRRKTPKKGDHSGI